MNTRLQVEHPITELTTGLDLVEEMIRVAAGEKLRWTQSDIGIKGWAMEARVYAEDPSRNFLPSIGTLQEYREPVPGKDGKIRVDSGLLDGDEISIYYDPMIAKVVGYGKDRNEAIHELCRALDSYVIKGVTHNIPFLRTVLDSPRYISGNISTKFIPEEFPKGFKGHELSPTQLNELLVSTTVMYAMRKLRDLTVSGKLLNFVPPQEISLVITFQNQHYNVSIQTQNNFSQYLVKIGDESFLANPNWKIDDYIFKIKINDGAELTLQLIEKNSQAYRVQHVGTKVIYIFFSLKKFIHFF